MTDDREAQITRLELAMSKAGSFHYSKIASDLYDAGARIPDPPPPPKVTLPVVSARAVQAYWNGVTGSCDAAHIHKGLRAAFAVILEDTAAAVPRNEYGYTVFQFRTPSRHTWAVSPGELSDILATLTGKAP